MREPKNLDVPVERPRALRQMAELVYGKPINYQRVAADSGVRARLVREIIDAHAAKGERAERSTERVPPTEELLKSDEKMR